MTTTALPITASKAALLMMDFQPTVLSTLDDPAALLDRARAALEWARTRQIQVVWVRVAFTPDDYAAVPSDSKAFAAVASNNVLADGDPGSAIDPSFSVDDDDVVVRKTRFGAFSTTDLASSLQQRGIDTLILAGISTGGVVLSTVRDAADRDYRLYVVADAIADPDPEVHRVLVASVFPRQAEIVDADDLPQLVDGPMRP